MTPVRHLTPEDLAQRLDVSVETVKHWRRMRTGPRFFYVGQHPRYRETDVAAWEKARLVTTRP